MIIDYFSYHWIFNYFWAFWSLPWFFSNFSHIYINQSFNWTPAFMILIFFHPPTLLIPTPHLSSSKDYFIYKILVRSFWLDGAPTSMRHSVLLSKWNIRMSWFLVWFCKMWTPRGLFLFFEMNQNWSKT